jgi:hypothetical protein
MKISACVHCVVTHYYVTLPYDLVPGSCHMTDSCFMAEKCHMAD